jgi:hypothetical protein
MTRATLLAAGCAALALALGACSPKAEDKAAEAPAAAATPASASASAGAAMKPTPGKWKMTTAMEGMPAGAMPAIEVCLTADDLKDDAWATGARRQDNCSKMESKVVGGVVTTHAVCASQGITTTMDITASGDFAKRYTVETVMKMEPAAPGAPNPMKMSVVAERLGDC